MVRAKGNRNSILPVTQSTNTTVYDPTDRISTNNFRRHIIQLGGDSKLVAGLESLMIGDVTKFNVVNHKLLAQVIVDTQRSGKSFRITEDYGIFTQLKDDILRLAQNVTINMRTPKRKLTVAESQVYQDLASIEREAEYLRYLGLVLSVFGKHYGLFEVGDMYDIVGSLYQAENMEEEEEPGWEAQASEGEEGSDSEEEYGGSIADSDGESDIGI